MELGVSFLATACPRSQRANWPEGWRFHMKQRRASGVSLLPHIGPIDSPIAAVKAAIVAEVKASK